MPGEVALGNLLRRLGEPTEIHSARGLRRNHDADPFQTLLPVGSSICYRPSPQTPKPQTGGASWQVKETASRITSYRRKWFSARPASPSHATSGSRLYSSSSESTGRKL